NANSPGGSRGSRDLPISYWKGPAQLMNMHLVVLTVPVESLSRRTRSGHPRSREARLQNCLYVFSGVPGEARTALRGSQEMGEMSPPRFIDAARAYPVQTFYGACLQLCYHPHVIEHTQPKAYR